MTRSSSRVEVVLPGELGAHAAGSRRPSCGRKMRRPSGDWAMPSRAISCVGSCVMSCPSNTMRPCARARVAEDRHHQRRLAGAVGADQRDDLAGWHVDVDVVQRVDVAVAGGDALQRQERAGALIGRPPPPTCADLLVLDAEIGGDDLGIVAHAVGRAVGDLARRIRGRRRGRRSP